MRTHVFLLAAAWIAAGTIGCGEENTAMPEKIYEIEIRTIDGREQKLGEYRGKVLLIVNTASRCGFTGQYEGLQALYEKYRGRGLVVLGFPANDFLGQEPGSNEEIRQFCTTDFGVSFPMFAKISVKGRDQHPLYRYLTSKKTNPEHAGRITWNFNKFLIDADGNVAARFGSRTAPDDPELVGAVENALAGVPQDGAGRESEADGEDGSG